MSSAWESSLQKMRVFGTSVRPGKSSVQRVAEGLQDGADLILHDDGAVELFRGVGEVVVELLPADSAGLFVAAIDEEAFLDRAALLGDLRFDAVNVVADIDAIGDGALVRIFADEVLIKEADRLFARRGGEPDEEGVEVFEDLPPEVVDGAMAFVGDDEVEGLDRDGGVVLRRRGFVDRRRRFRSRIFRRGLRAALRRGAWRKGVGWCRW